MHLREIPRLFSLTCHRSVVCCLQKMADMIVDSADQNSKTGGSTKTLIEALAHQGPEVVRDAFQAFDQESRIKQTVDNLARQTAETLARIEEIKSIMSDMKAGPGEASQPRAAEPTKASHPL